MASERNDGLEALQGRVQRRPRQVLPPKRPREPQVEKAQVNEADASISSHAPLPSDPVESDLVEREQEPMTVDALPAEVLPEPSSPVAPKTSASPASSPEQTKRPVEPREMSASTEAPPTRRLEPQVPLANLAVRVRKPLDRLLGHLVREMQDTGVRTSKAELVELLLWELPDEPTPALRARLAAFRQHAPREQQP